MTIETMTNVVFLTSIFRNSIQGSSAQLRRLLFKSPPMPLPLSILARMEIGGAVLYFPD
jgi:hypothetical protein